MSTVELDRLIEAARRQPGARERASGTIKFQCPACAAEGHDQHQDNAGLFVHDGKWGCAFASGDSELGRAHWDAIGRQLGAFERRNGLPAPAVPPNGTSAVSDDDVPTASGPMFTVYDAAEEWTFPPPGFIVAHFILERGVTWVGGAPKRFKSLLVYYICLAIASGRESIAERFRILAHPKILYISREDHGGRLNVRKQDTLMPWGVRPKPGALLMLIRPHFDLLNPRHVAWLRDTCRQRGITVVVLDTWTALSPSADPLGAKEQTELAAVVSQLAEGIEGAVVVIDHTRKNRPEGQALSPAEILGPSQKWQAAEHIVMVETTGDRHRLEVFIEGKDAETERFFLAVSPEGSGTEKFTYAGTIEEIAEAQRAVGDHNRDAVHRVLLDAGQPVTPAEAHAAAAARSLRLAKETVANHLRALAKEGRAVVSGKGKATRYLGIAATPSDAIAVRDSEMFAEARS